MIAVQVLQFIINHLFILPKMIILTLGPGDYDHCIRIAWCVPIAPRKDSYDLIRCFEEIKIIVRQELNTSLQTKEPWTYWLFLCYTSLLAGQFKAEERSISVILSYSVIHFCSKSRWRWQTDYFTTACQNCSWIC